MQKPRIDSYRFGEIIIDGRRYTQDVIIYPDHVDDRWWREEGHSVATSDLQEVLESHPDVLVIGQEADRIAEPSAIVLVGRNPVDHGASSLLIIGTDQEVVAALPRDPELADFEFLPPQQNLWVGGVAE